MMDTSSVNEPQKNVLLDRLKQRKIIVIAVVVVFLILFIIIAIMLQSGSTPPATDQPVSPTSIRQEITSVPSQPQLSGVSKNNIPKWNTYTGSGYSFQYPFDWSAQKFDLEGGGELVIVKPNVLPNGIYYPGFSLEKEPALKTRINQKAGILKALGLVESDTNIFNQQAKKLSGTVPFKMVGSQKVNEPIQQTDILFQYGTDLYTIEYKYEGSQVSTDLVEYFNNFISSIQLQ